MNGHVYHDDGDLDALMRDMQLSEPELGASLLDPISGASGAWEVASNSSAPAASDVKYAPAPSWTVATLPFGGAAAASPFGASFSAPSSSAPSSFAFAGAFAPSSVASPSSPPFSTSPSTLFAPSHGATDWQNQSRGAVFDPWGTTPSPARPTPAAASVSATSGFSFDTAAPVAAAASVGSATSTGSVESVDNRRGGLAAQWDPWSFTGGSVATGSVATVSAGGGFAATGFAGGFAAGASRSDTIEEQAAQFIGWTSPYAATSSALVSAHGSAQASQASHSSHQAISRPLPPANDQGLEPPNEFGIRMALGFKLLLHQIFSVQFGLDVSDRLRKRRVADRAQWAAGIRSREEAALVEQRKQSSDHYLGNMKIQQMGIGKSLISWTEGLVRRQRLLQAGVPAQYVMPVLSVMPGSIMPQSEQEIRNFFGDQFQVIIYDPAVLGYSAFRALTVEDLAQIQILIVSYDRLKADARAFPQLAHAHCIDKKTVGRVPVEDPLDEMDHAARAAMPQWYKDVQSAKLVGSALLFCVPFSAVILDESHGLASSTTEMFRAVTAIRSPHRQCLTGTPFRNGGKDMWAQLFAAGLDSHRDASRWSVDVYKQLGLENHVLQMTLKDAGIELPPKTTSVAMLDMTREQKRLYDLYVERGRKVRQTGASQIDMLVVMTRLRQICNAPFQVVRALQRSIEEDRAKDAKELAKAGLAAPGFSAPADAPVAPSAPFPHLSFAPYGSIGGSLTAGGSEFKEAREGKASDSSAAASNGSEEHIWDNGGAAGDDDTSGDDFGMVGVDYSLRSIFGISKNDPQYTPELRAIEDWASDFMGTAGIRSPKMQEFVKLVTDARSMFDREKQTWRRVIGVSDYLGTLEIAAAALENAGVSYVLLRGKQKGDRKTHREEVLREFTAPGSTIRVLLMTKRVGAVGLNLTQADCMFFFDEWWSKQVDDQAEGRVYRIKQTRPVDIVYARMKDSIEARIAAVALKKLQEGHYFLLGSTMSEEDREQHEKEVQNEVLDQVFGRRRAGPLGSAASSGAAGGAGSRGNGASKAPRRRQ